jgi:hypothetical protein
LRAIDESSGSDILVFIDDDERPREGWLAPLVTTWQRSGASAVMGRVISEFEGELDPWVAAGEVFRRRSMATGTPITVAAAGNLLLDLSQVNRFGARFDARVGLGSGEDSLFSRELVRRGGSMVWCQESVATDVVPRSRMTRAWVLARARSHGNAESSSPTDPRPGWAFVRAICRAASCASSEAPRGSPPVSCCARNGIRRAVCARPTAASASPPRPSAARIWNTPASHNVSATAIPAPRTGATFGDSI